MSKYGMGSLHVEDVNIKLESDSIYLPEVPAERSIYDFYNEIELLGNKGMFIDNKVHMMSDIIVDMVSLKETASARCKTESEFSSSNAIISSKLSDITNRVSECLKGTDCEVGNTPQSFKPNYVDVKFESFDGMDFNAKMTYRMEGVGEVFSKIWDYIKRFFKWVWESIKKLFNSIFNLFRSNRKLLANLKLELEKMSLEKGERTEYTASNGLIFFTQVLNGRNRDEYVNNIMEALKLSKDAQGDPYLSTIQNEMEKIRDTLNSNANVIGNSTNINYTLISASLKSYLDKAKDPVKVVRPLRPELAPSTRVFQFGNTDAVNVGKFKDAGNYYIIGYDNDECAFLYSPNGVYSDVVRATILSGKDILFKKMTADSAKQELIELCDLGISICDEFDKKHVSTIENDFKGQESDMVNTIEVIGNIFSEIEMEDKYKNEVTRDLTALTNILTKNVNRSTTSIIAAISIVAKQPTFILKTVKEGMYTIE